MANVLPRDTRTAIVTALCEGNSIRAVERMTGVAKSTILRLAVAVGEGCVRLHNNLVRGVVAPEIECDEQWSFVQKKQSRVTDADGAERGDAWTFVGFDRRSKLVIAFAVGKRDDRVLVEVVLEGANADVITYDSAIGVRDRLYSGAQTDNALLRVEHITVNNDLLSKLLAEEQLTAVLGERGGRIRGLVCDVRHVRTLSPPHRCREPRVSSRGNRVESLWNKLQRRAVLSGAEQRRFG